MAEHRRRGWARGPDLHSLLAYGYRPLYRLLRRVRIKHADPRDHVPEDTLLPDGFVAEVVATGLTTPVHCTFSPDGACYVTEAGYRTEHRPRILRIDVETGAVETIYELPEERWFKTGAVTGACWHEGALYVTNTDDRGARLRRQPHHRPGVEAPARRLRAADPLRVRARRCALRRRLR